MSYQQLLQEVEKLSRLERQQLLETIKSSLEQSLPHQLQELKGLGKEMWQDRDAQEYVNQERDAWQD
jgi:sensor domain CHASE-containing protein